MPENVVVNGTKRAAPQREPMGLCFSAPTHSTGSVQWSRATSVIGRLALRLSPPSLPRKVFPEEHTFRTTADLIGRNTACGSLLCSVAVVAPRLRASTG